MSKPLISLVVAMNQDNVIGVDNQLPWHLPEDLAYFKKVTSGKPIIMGRKTFESIGRVLPNRKNIVISASGFTHDGVVTYSSLELALQDNQEYPEICIIGGGQIFAQSMGIADVLHVTKVDYKVDNACAYFPVIDEKIWQCVSTENLVSQTGIKFSINIYERHK